MFINHKRQPRGRDPVGQNVRNRILEEEEEETTQTKAKAKRRRNLGHLSLHQNQKMMISYQHSL